MDIPPDNRLPKVMVVHAIQSTVISGGGDDDIPLHPFHNPLSQYNCSV